MNMININPSIFIAVWGLIQITIGVQPIFQRRLMGGDYGSQFDDNNGYGNQFEFHHDHNNGDDHNNDDDDDIPLYILEQFHKQEHLNMMKQKIEGQRIDFMTFKRQYQAYPQQLQDIPNDHCKKDFIDVWPVVWYVHVKQFPDPQLQERYQELMISHDQDINNIVNGMDKGLKDCNDNLRNRMKAKGLTWIEKPDKHQMISMYSDFFTQHLNDVAMLKSQFDTYPFLKDIEQRCSYFVDQHERMFGAMFLQHGEPKIFGSQRASKVVSDLMTESKKDGKWAVNELKEMVEKLLSSEADLDDLLQQLSECSPKLRSTMDSFHLTWV